MNKVKVRKEKWPERCEVCHKTDCFDPTKNYCLRCQEIQNSQKNLYETPYSNLDAFGRPLILGYIEVQAEILRETNKRNINHIDGIKILSVWIIRGFIGGSIISCASFSVLSFLEISSRTFTNFWEMAFGLIMGSIFFLIVFGFLGTLIGFLYGVHLIVINCLREILKEKKNYSKSYNDL